MSSALRLSIIMVLLLATSALGLVAYSAYLPKPVVKVEQSTPPPHSTGYLVAAYPLPAGTLARDKDFAVRFMPSDSVPTGAILDTSDARIGLRGSVLRKSVDTGTPVMSQDLLGPRDRGFLASVLAPGRRAVSINVDTESGVSDLISPGDHVDVVSTQVIEKAGAGQQTVSETVVHNVRIIAIDQEVAQGGPANNAAAGKATHTVSLEVAPKQVEKITVAKQVGKLSLAAVEQPGEAGATFTTVVVNAGDKVKEYSVKADGGSDER
jgi:pilus assembly protein CpaB